MTTTSASISKYCKDKITFYETITDFSTPPTNDDVLLTMTPAWDTVNSVANTPMVTFNSGNSGAGSDKVVLRNIHEPEVSSDAATKAYVDGIAVTGVSWKNTVRVSTIGNIAVFPPTDGVTTVSTIDGITLATGDRVLVRSQTDGTQNGIYEVTSGTWVRSADVPDAVGASGFAVWVDAGTLNGDKGFVVTNDQGSDVVGTDALVWSKFSSSHGVAGADGAIQFASNGGHAAASAGTFSWDDSNYKMLLSSSASGQNALELTEGDIELVEGHINLSDTSRIRYGGGSGMTIRHDSYNGNIENVTGSLILKNFSATGDTVFAVGDSAGATSFNFNSSGGNLTTMDSNGVLEHKVGSHQMNDSIPMYIGSSQDLTISHDGTDTSLVNATGEFKIQQTASGSDISFENTSTTAGDDMNFKLGGSTNGTSFNFVGDSQGTPATLVQILSVEEESTSLSTGTLRVQGGASFTGEVSGVCFNMLSDATTKTNITPIGMDDPLAKLKQVEGFNYKFLPGYGKADKLNTGVLAQQIETIPGLEHCVNTDPDTGYKSVNYIFLIPMLIEAVKALAEKVDKK